MAGTGQVSMLQMSPSLPKLLAQTHRWLQRGPSDACCPALHGGKCPKSALDPKVSDLGESAQNLVLTLKSASWGPAGWAPQMILDLALPRGLAQLWHGSGCCNAADVSAGFPGSQVLAPSGSSPGQGMGAWGGTLGTMGPAWQCQPCAQLGLVRSCSRLGCTCAIPCAPLCQPPTPPHPKAFSPLRLEGLQGRNRHVGSSGVLGALARGVPPRSSPAPPGFAGHGPPQAAPGRSKGRGENAPSAARCKLPVESLIQTMGSG